MRNKRISELSAIGTLTGAEILPIVQSGNTRQGTIDDIFIFLGGREIYTTGGTYSNGTAIFTNNTGGTFSVTGFTTGSSSTDTYITGGTPNNAGSLYTFTNNTGGTFSVLGLPDVFTTGGTYSNGTATFRNSTGGTFDVTGFSTSGGTGSTTVDVLANVTEIATWNKVGYTEIIVTDNLRGGNFFPYTGSYSADSGMIFSDGAGNKWKRQNRDNYINIDWYGCVQVNNQSNDSYAKIMAAIRAAASTEFLRSPIIFIPACPTSYWYYCTQKIIIDDRITIFGAGFESHIRFYQNAGGFKFNYITSRFSIINDFKITQYGSSAATTIGSNFGFECKDIIYANNITVNGFGDGVMAWNDSAADPEDFDYGNSNNMRWINCDFSGNWRHGTYLRGADSNNSIFDYCNWVGNGGCGHFDKSFLGNSVSFPHFASNGSPELAYQKGLVTYSGNTYASIVDDNLNNLPTDINYWHNLGTLWVSGFPYVLPWSAGTNYYTVTSINCDGANQYGAIIQIYHEADQAPPYAGPSVKVLGKNVDFRDESSTASLNAANGSLYTLAPFWVGLPGGSNTLRGYVSNSAVGLMYGASEAVMFGYDTTGKKGFITTNNAETSGGVWFTTTDTTAATLGRTTGTGANGNLALSSFAFASMANSRSTFRKLDFTNSYSPSTSNLDYGDLFFITTTSFLGPKPEAIVTKYVEPTVGGSKKLYTIKGFQEEILSNVSGTTQIGIDYSVATDRGICYDVEFAGSNATDSCSIHHRILVVNRSGTATTLSDVAIGTDYVPGSFASAAFVITNVGAGSGSDDIKVTITNLPAGTYGKVHIKRMDY